MSRIVFSAPMVSAIVDGRKTMTRRVAVPHDRGDGVLDFRFPYQPGDRIAVAETHWAFGHWEPKPGLKGWQFVCDRPDDIRFEAPNCALPSMDKADPGISTWYKRNARFMPTRYARLHLEVSGVRVERLQEISESYAQSEGVEPLDSEIYDHDWKICPKCGGTCLHGALGPNLGVMEVDCRDCDTHKKRFQHLWNSLHQPPDDWAGNPWVYVVQFERVLEK